jgi:hypothetical protein
MWKTLRVSHIPTPSAATTDKLQTRRYTNNLLGTKDRSGQLLFEELGKKLQFKKPKGSAICISHLLICEAFTATKSTPMELPRESKSL